MGTEQNEISQERNFIEIISENGKKDIHYSAFLNYLPEEYKIIVEKELNETEENKANGVQTLKDYLKKKSISCPDDHELIWVLRGCKYDIEKAKKKIVKFLQIRSLIRQKVSEIDDRKIKAILDDLVFGVLPYTDQHGNVIIFTRPTVNLDMYDMDEVCFCFGALLLCLFTYPIVTVTGLSFIIECKTPAISIFYPITKAYIKHASLAFTFPVRFKRIELLNENFLVRWCYNILRPILPLKLTKRTSFHQNQYESLQKRYHPDILPEDFDGALGPLNNKCYKEIFLHFVDELKRGKISKNI